MCKKSLCRIMIALMGTLALAAGGTKPKRNAAAGSSKAAPSAAARRVNLDADPHLAGWWKLDESSGNTAADASGRKRNGTLMGGLSFDKNSAPGRIGKALRFEGGPGLLQISGYKGVTGTQPRTCAAWIKTAVAGGQIMSWGTDDAGKMWFFRIVGSGIYVDPKGGYLYTKSPVNDGAWHHVAAVIEPGDPPNLGSNGKLYKDGALQEIHDIGLLDLYPIDTGNELNVTIGQGFKGLMDDVRIYDRALSGDEIKALFLAAGPAAK